MIDKLGGICEIVASSLRRGLGPGGWGERSRRVSTAVQGGSATYIALGTGRLRPNPKSQIPNPKSQIPSPQLLAPSPRTNATTPFRPAALFLLAVAAVCLTGCFGYQVGNHTLFPQHVRTVSVQMFHSDSFRRNIGEQLTEAVAKEIESRMDCKVVDSTEADATLAGRVVSATKNGLTETRNDDLREIEYNLYILVEWHVHGLPAGPQGEMVAIPSSLLEFNRASSLVPEVGQSIATAQQKAIERLARQIVDQLETPWYADDYVE